MSFFQNVFETEFQATWPLERKWNLTFKIPPNPNSTSLMVAWNAEPYDLSSDNTLTFNYAIDRDNFKIFTALTINCAGTTASATTAADVAKALNANADFALRFSADVVPSNPKGSVLTGVSNPMQVIIKCTVGRDKVLAYISNTGAEKHLKFNAKAGVAELPTFFARHTIANIFSFTDSIGRLIQLDESDAAVGKPIIVLAGFDPTKMQADWQLLAGRSPNEYNCLVQTVNANNQVTALIEYPTGAKAGDMAKKTIMTYTHSTDTNPATLFTAPYVLASGDLLSGP